MGDRDTVANHQLRMLLDAGTVVGLSDGQLLELFANRRDETAFTALVERHGPMVRRVCGEVLGNHHDAEDAFQATFLVLARQVGSIRHRESVASWLYGVALRVSACARSAAARRRRQERNWGAVRAAHLDDMGESQEDLRPLLHAEIGQLSERFVRRWYSAGWRAGPTKRRPGCSAARWEQSRAAWPRRVSGCGSGWSGSGRSCWWNPSRRIRE